MPYCVAFGCNSKQFKGCGLHFFAFPKQKYERQAWINYCKRSDFTIPTKYSTLCSLHFSKTCYERDPEKLAEFGYTNAKPKLFKNAVPDIELKITGNETFAAPKKNRPAVEKRRKTEAMNAVMEKLKLEAEKSNSNMSEQSQDTANIECNDTCVSELLESRTPDTVAKVRTIQCQTTVELNIKQSTKRISAKPDCRSKATQIHKKTKNVGTQCNLVKLPPLVRFSDCEDGLSDSAETESTGTSTICNIDDEIADPDYEPGSEHEDNDEENSDSDEETTIKLPNFCLNGNAADERYFIVSETKLLETLQTCRFCSGNCVVSLNNACGTMITVHLTCQNGHSYIWQSQVLHKKLPLGNLMLSTAILSTGNSVSHLISLFNTMNLPVFTDKTYYNIQSKYLIPSVYRVWDLHQADHITQIQGSDLTVGGDGQCDSPGHSAKYCSYTVMDLNTNVILDIKLVQSNEVRNSSCMELEGLKRCLEYLEDCDVAIKTLVTDRHVQVKKYMRENHTDKKHYFDVWHVAKGISKKLEKAAKKKQWREIRPWIKSIVNHVYWVALSSGDDGEMKVAKWLSIINHVANIHEGHSETFPRCAHQTLDTPRMWIKQGSKAHKKLKEIVESKYLIKDIANLSPYHQTYGLEVFHSVKNTYAPKSTHFFYPSMEARTYIAALHHNEN